MEADRVFYDRRAQQELDAASATADPAIKAIHLDFAARYVTLSELAEHDGVGSLPASHEASADRPL